MGDLNVAPLPIDVYDPQAMEEHVCYHPAVRKALARIMDWGFTDLFRKHYADAGQYTFWDYRRGSDFARNRGWRIDHIMATAPWRTDAPPAPSTANYAAADRPSDHTSIIAEFKK